MTQHITISDPPTDNAASGTIRFGDALPDEQSLPPFQALDRMHAAGQRIDGALSSLIGHLAPYCDDQNLQGDTLRAAPADEGPSGLERRIQREEAILAEIAQNAESLIGRLRL